MKKFLSIVSILLVVFGVLSFVGCNSKTEVVSEKVKENQQPSKERLLASLMNEYLSEILRINIDIVQWKKRFGYDLRKEAPISYSGKSVWSCELNGKQYVFLYFAEYRKEVIVTNIIINEEKCSTNFVFSSDYSYNPWGTEIHSIIFSNSGKIVGAKNGKFVNSNANGNKVKELSSRYFELPGDVRKSVDSKFSEFEESLPKIIQMMNDDLLKRQKQNSLLLNEYYKEQEAAEAKQREIEAKKKEVEARKREKLENEIRAMMVDCK